MGGTEHSEEDTYREMGRRGERMGRRGERMGRRGERMGRRGGMGRRGEVGE